MGSIINTALNTGKKNVQNRVLLRTLNLCNCVKLRDLMIQRIHIFNYWSLGIYIYLKQNSMNSYPIFGLIVTFIPLVLIVAIVIKRGKKIFEQ